MNLNVDRFQNGDLIEEAKTADEWVKCLKEKRPAFCYLNNTNSKGSEKGKLYNWYAINDARGLAPKGWKIPSAADWNQLIKYAGGVNGAGKNLKSKSGWVDVQQNLNFKNGLDLYGFNAIPSGERFSDGGFSADNATFWSSSEINPTEAEFVELLPHLGQINQHDNYYVTGGFLTTSKGSGKSVRCIKMTDLDKSDFVSIPELKEIDIVYTSHLGDGIGQDSESNPKSPFLAFENAEMNIHHLDGTYSNYSGGDFHDEYKIYYSAKLSITGVFSGISEAGDLKSETKNYKILQIEKNKIETNRGVFIYARTSSLVENQFTYGFIFIEKKVADDDCRCATFIWREGEID